MARMATGAAATAWPRDRDQEDTCLPEMCQEEL
jgi:hypothetical protein